MTLPRCFGPWKVAEGALRRASNRDGGGLLGGAPNFHQKVVKHRVVFFEFGADKRVEIVPVEKRLRALGKVFTFIGKAVMANGLARVEQDVFVELRTFGGFEGRDDFGVLKPEELIVVGVREFVKDDGRVLQHLGSGKQMSGLGNVDFLFQTHIVAVFPEPSLAGMILHGVQGGMCVLDPDLEGLEFLEPVLRDKDLDALEMVRQQGERAGSLGLMGAVEQGGIDVNGPAFDVALDGVEARGGRFGPLQGGERAE